MFGPGFTETIRHNKIRYHYIFESVYRPGTFGLRSVSSFDPPLYVLKGIWQYIFILAYRQEPLK